MSLVLLFCHHGTMIVRHNRASVSCCDEPSEFCAKQTLPLITEPMNAVLGVVDARGAALVTERVCRNGSRAVWEKHLWLLGTVFDGS